MKFITFLIGFIFLISCNTNQPQNSDTYHDSVRLDTISNYKPIKKPNKQRWDTLYVSMNNDALVFGDSANKEISYVAIKYEPHIKFLDFKVDSVFKGQRHSLDFSSNPPSKMFKTRIREAYKSGNANFAGHYYLTDWGCGSPCQMCAIVDLVSGRIYNGPAAALGYEFQKDSRMLVVNPTNHTGTDVFHPKPDYYLDCPYCKPEIYIWDDKKHEFEKR